MRSANKIVSVISRAVSATAAAAALGVVGVATVVPVMSAASPGTNYHNAAMADGGPDSWYHNG